MPRVAEPDQDLVDRFQVVVDPAAEPVDVDRLVARFLIKLVRNGKQSRTSTGVSGGGERVSTRTGARKGTSHATK